MNCKGETQCAHTSLVDIAKYVNVKTARKLSALAFLKYVPSEKEKKIRYLFQATRDTQPHPRQDITNFKFTHKETIGNKHHKNVMPRETIY